MQRFKNIVKESLYFFYPSFLSSKSVSVLMYHSIAENDIYFTVRPKLFEAQMAYLAEHQIPVVSLQDVAACIQQGKDLPKGSVVITFDDGYKDNFTTAFPILQKYHFPATIFVSTGFIGQQIPNSSGQPLRALSISEMEIMANSGLIDFQPHTVTHPKLPRISISQASEEISSSRHTLENMFQKKCDIFAYPSGKYTHEHVTLLKQLGFVGAVTVESGLVRTGDDLYTLSRNSVDSMVSLAQFKKIVTCGRLSFF